MTRAIGGPDHPRSVAVAGGGRLWPLVAMAAVVVGLVAWRATLGMSFQDDGYYAAGTIRLALGGRLFVDEMLVQSLGFLAAVPFAKLWTTLFGMTGVVVALRLFYVAVATATAVVVYRLLRPSCDPWVSLTAAAVPFLAPAYALFAVTYDTMAAIGMVLACTLAFAAARDSRRSYAAAAGAAAAFAAVSYPPIVLAAIALLVTLAVHTRDRRLVGAMCLGAGAVVGTFAVWLLATTSVAELAVAYRFVVGSWSSMPESIHGPRIAVDLWELGGTLGRTWIVPLWAWFGPAAAISVWTTYDHRRAPHHDRAHGLALALLPLALAVPVLANRAALANTSALATLGGNYLIAFVAFVLPPMLVSLRRAESSGRDLARIAVPVGLVGFLAVVVSSNASIQWASAIVGLAPLALAAVVWWGSEIAETLAPAAAAAASAVLVCVLLVLLFGSAFKDDPPMSLRHTLASGAYAGLTTSSAHAAQVAELERLALRWIRPSTTVMAVALPGAYLVSGGVPLTNNVWLNQGAFDRFAVEYLDRAGRWPDIVWVPLRLVDQPASDVAADPLLSAVTTRYTIVERSPIAGIAVYAASGVGQGRGQP